MKRLYKNFRAAIRYSDTQLYELSLSLLMIFLNPFHLLGLTKCIHIESIMVVLLMLLSIVVGIGLFVGVLLHSLEQRYFIARLYWFFTLLTIVSILQCGLHENGLLASFILQFISSIFLVWRLGTEKIYREIQKRLRE